MRFSLPLETDPEFTLLPSDPTVPLTPAQTAALWGGDVDGMLLALAQDYLTHFQHHQRTPCAATTPTETAANHA